MTRTSLSRSPRPSLFGKRSVSKHTHLAPSTSALLRERAHRAEVPESEIIALILEENLHGRPEVDKRQAHVIDVALGKAPE